MRPEVTGAVVERLDDNEFRLVGREVERVVALNDVTTPKLLTGLILVLSGSGFQKCWPERALLMATSCGSASSALNTRPMCELVCSI